MTVRNIKQIHTSVLKLSGDEVKFTGIQSLEENGKFELVSEQHDLIMDTANELRKIASDLVASEKVYVSENIGSVILTNPELVSALASKLSKTE